MHELFNEVLQVYYVSAALSEKSICRFALSYDDIVVKTTFGLHYIHLYDGSHTLYDWGMFEDCIPVVTHHTMELIYIEDELKAYIIQILAAEEVVPSTL